MVSRLLVITMCAAIGATAAANRPAPTSRSENFQVQVAATLYADKAAIQHLLGSDLGGFYVVVHVQVTPKSKEKLKVFRDDFLLRTDRDGERSKPWAPSQIAGRGGLVVSQTGEGGVMGDSGPTFGGGFPGSGGGFGNSGTITSNQTKVNTGAKDKANPLMGVLTEKVLPEKEIEEPASGLLYFPMEGKQKVKDLELTYSGAGGKLIMRFR